MPGSETASFRVNPIDFSSSWVERSLHAKFELPMLPRSGSSMVGDKKKKKAKQVSVELEASLATAEAEVGAVAKADQYIKNNVKIQVLCAAIIFHIQFANDICSLQHTLQSACFKATSYVNCGRFKYSC